MQWSTHAQIPGRIRVGTLIARVRTTGKDDKTGCRRNHEGRPRGVPRAIGWTLRAEQMRSCSWSYVERSDQSYLKCFESRVKSPRKKRRVPNAHSPSLCASMCHCVGQLCLASSDLHVIAPMSHFICSSSYRAKVPRGASLNN